MLEHENIDEMTTRFMHIINQLKALGKRYSNVEMVRKILRSLSTAQYPKVTHPIATFVVSEPKTAPPTTPMPIQAYTTTSQDIAATPTTARTLLLLTFGRHQRVKATTL